MLTSLSQHPLFRQIRFRSLTAALFIGLGAFILCTFRQYGISNDELVQHTYGRLLLHFYSSGFSDQSAFNYRNLYLYGGFFDLIAALLEHLVPLWVWDMRHLLSALFGLSGIWATYHITRLLGGERAGFVVVVLLALTGAWSGAMFTHTKDIPFAACMAWALYYSMRIAQQLPKPPLALSIRLGIAVGCALGLRIGGIFAVLYLLATIAIAGCIARTTLHARFAYWFSALVALLPAGVVAFLLMALFWPWGVMAPDHPLQAAQAFSHFSFNMLTVMDGEVMRIGDVPRYYLLAYLLIRLPEIVLLGLVGMLGFSGVHLWRFVRQPQQLAQYAKQAHLPEWLTWFIVGLAALFPLAFILFDKPALYNGVRHFTFVVPPLAVLAALGLCAIWDALESSPKTQLAFVAISMLLVVNTGYTLTKLHPYEYIYYNRLAGNMAHAEHQWEGDYWSSSLREASEILESDLYNDQTSAEASKRPPYKVAVCAESIQGQAYLDKRFQVTSDWVAADFFISSTNMNCDQVLRGRVIGTVKRMGVTLAVIKDRRGLTGRMRFPTPAPH